MIGKIYPENLPNDMFQLWVNLLIRKFKLNNDMKEFFEVNGWTYIERLDGYKGYISPHFNLVLFNEEKDVVEISNMITDEGLIFHKVSDYVGGQEKKGLYEKIKITSTGEFVNAE